MALDPSRRYQSPAALLQELESAAKRSQNGSDSEPACQPRGEGDIRGQSCTIMVVESDPLLQERLRAGLKNAGYRVLLTGDPQWAMAQVNEDKLRPDCVVIDGESLGEAGVRAFNHLGSDPKTQALPAILLVGELQRNLHALAVPAQRRPVLLTPLKLKVLRDTLRGLLPEAGAAAPNEL
jgi:CheY-like chemotaxis protein